MTRIAGRLARLAVGRAPFAPLPLTLQAGDDPAVKRDAFLLLATTQQRLALGLGQWLFVWWLGLFHGSASNRYDSWRSRSGRAPNVFFQPSSAGAVESPTGCETTRSTQYEHRSGRSQLGAPEL